MIKNIMLALVLVIGLSGIGSTESYYLSGSGSYNSWNKILPESGYTNTEAFSYVAYATMSPTYTSVPGYSCYTVWNCKIDFADAPSNIMQTIYNEYVRLDVLGCPAEYGGTATTTIGAVWSDTVAGGWTTSGIVRVGGTSDYVGSWTMFVAITEYDYNLTGDGSCLNSFELQINTTSDGWTTAYINESVGGAAFNYNIPLVYEFDYRIYVNGDLVHSFTCDGHELYDADLCSHTQYRFEESCGNLIPDSEGYACAEEPELFYCYEWEAPTGIYDLSNSSIIKLGLDTQTFIGQTGWIIDPVVSGTTYTLENPNIAWGLKVIVQNESDGSLIDGAMVKVDQTCYCTDGYSTRQKMTVGGMVEYGDMSLQDASLMVMKTGYKILNENSTSYPAFLSGRSNFSSKTWIVKLAPSSSNNTTSFYEVSNKVDIHFRDVGGNRTSQILDTDVEVYLYYENNNTNEEAMTLKFQSSSTHTYFIDVDSWTIAYDDIGHKTIPQADFTPWDYSYRAVIYNSSIYGWNMTIPLTVRNGTKEEEQHYQNLTTNLWFLYAHDGRVDYRDDMSVAIHARSNNTTLMNIDVELWDNGVYKDHVNLTETDFAGADFPYYYVWNPIYDYETGHNYTVLMYGFDRTLLETDYVECISDETTRKNKLTIGVKDSHGAQLTNAYIYLEDWGSLPTGNVYYNAYEGIDNGDYRYKATKSGYAGGGWDEVNLTDEDKIVWYVLTEDYANTSFSQTKFEDRDIKGIFFPLMYFLLICLLLGGLKYVAS